MSILLRESLTKMQIQKLKYLVGEAGHIEQGNMMQVGHHLVVLAHLPVEGNLGDSHTEHILDKGPLDRAVRGYHRIGLQGTPPDEDLAGPVVVLGILQAVQDNLQADQGSHHTTQIREGAAKARLRTWAEVEGRLVLQCGQVGLGLPRYYYLVHLKGALVHRHRFHRVCVVPHL